MIITSVQNPKVKEYVKLMNQKKERDLSASFIVEGEHLVFEAIHEGVVKEILVLEGKSYDLPMEYITVTKDVMNKICDTKSPQGIIARCVQKESKLPEGTRYLLLDDVQDPGNLGTLLRSADAFSFDAVILSENTVDLYNPKVIRATQGAIFRVTTLRMPILEAITSLQKKGVKVFAADLNGQALKDLPPDERMGIVLGNEAQGISSLVRSHVDGRVTIEMTGGSESLNVSVAGSIIMYNFRK